MADPGVATRPGEIMAAEIAQQPEVLRRLWRASPEWPWGGDAVVALAPGRADVVVAVTASGTTPTRWPSPRRPAARAPP